MNADKSESTVKQEIESVLKKGPVDKRIPGCYCWECCHSILVEAKDGGYRKKWFCRHIDVPVEGLPNEYFGCVLGELRDGETRPLTPEEAEEHAQEHISILRAQLGVAVKALDTIRQGMYKMDYTNSVTLTCCYCGMYNERHVVSCPVRVACDAKDSIDRQIDRQREAENQGTTEATATEEIQRLHDISISSLRAQLATAIGALTNIRQGMFRIDYHDDGNLLCGYCGMSRHRHTPSCPVQIAHDAKAAVEMAGGVPEDTAACDT